MNFPQNISSNSYNSKGPNHYQQNSLHPQIPGLKKNFRNSIPVPNSPKEAVTHRNLIQEGSESSGIAGHSQNSYTQNSSGYLVDNIPPRQAEVVDYRRVGQRIQKDNQNAVWEKFLREGEEKANILAKQVLAYSEQMKELDKKMKAKTETPRQIIKNWYKIKKGQLKMTRDKLLDDLETQEKHFFDDKRFDEEIEKAKKNIAILTGDFKDLHQLYASHCQVEKIKKLLEEKREVLEQLGNSLLETIDGDVFKTNIYSMIDLNEKVYNTLEFPEFVDKAKHERIRGGESVLTTRATILEQKASVLYESVLSARNLNFSQNLRVMEENYE